MSAYINRSERLASAIYLITSFFTDLEPIKWKLRTLASEMVSLSVSLNNVAVKDRESLVSDLKDSILKTARYFSVASNAGIISRDNGELMQEELRKYSNALSHQTTVTDLLKVGALDLEAEKTAKHLMIERKIEAPTSPKPLKEFGVVRVKKNNRQSIIIGVLKRKREIMIKDVSLLVNGCSEKTIQRELSNMVKSGVLKKTGEKRWSKYSLA